MTKPLPDPERKSNLLFEAGALLLAAAVATVMVLHLRAGSGTALKGPLPPPAAEVLAGLPPETLQSETAVFAGGCFWGVQAVFQHTRGVLQAVAGYAGGEAGQANYQMVSSGITRHAEVVSIRFDPRQISYAQLLQIFFLSLMTRPSWTASIPMWARSTARQLFTKAPHSSSSLSATSHN